MTSKSFENSAIQVRGGNVNNLKNIDIDIPLGKIVAISGPSGSGKSSLAMGILYAEGSRRYLEALSTYTRRRITQDKRSDVRSVRHIPSALALRQRPTIPSERSTVGSMSEIFNVVRLVFSRLGSAVCPNGHRLAPTLAIAHAMDLPNKPNSGMGIVTCPECGVKFMAFSAEDFAFNSTGACPTCHGTGSVRELDESMLIGDENLSLEDGAVASWHLPGRNFMPKVAESIGVRIDVAYKDLTDHEKDIVLHGEKAHYPVDLTTGTGRVFHMDNALYENAREAVLDSARTSTSSRSIAQINRFFHFSQCPTCHGSRLDPKLLTQHAADLNIAQVSDLQLGALPQWRDDVLAQLPANMRAMGSAIFAEFDDDVRPLLELGLDYLTLSRAGNTLSTGELQRIQLARTLRTETTGVLYVLDEPSIGLHPDNVTGLIDIFHALVTQGNSLVVVDHETDVIAAADWVIEIGPGSGDEGGRIIGQGSPSDLAADPDSLIGPFLAGTAPLLVRDVDTASAAQDYTTLTVDAWHNLHDVTARFPSNRMSVVTGFSGAGKTSLILDNLVPALHARAGKRPAPPQVSALNSDLTDVVSVDAAPVGKNARSTLATYSGVMDRLRHLFDDLPQSRKLGLGISAFSSNSKEGACPHCNGLGYLTLDIQYMPDMEEVCPYCHGTRFNDDIAKITWNGRSIVDVLSLSVRQALPVFAKVPGIHRQLKLLDEVGLGYLHLGESTPTLSGGEAQRLKLVKHMDRRQVGTLFVFDEPTIGLHPLDVQVLLGVIDKLLAQGATVLAITHDMDLMANSDWLVDLGPRGGDDGGRIMAQGTPAALIHDPAAVKRSLTLRHLKKYWDKFTD
ncbi:MAG: excinuclease ABC subunit UvrA [Bifidobacteriaceae bacterium]|jgi:excinuclease ABC subunit A|nr:excinuclease ABC subunit UvrA [Bifidobacteriaceae bacterium]MCI1914935.1 excinuclease ABC subunit UvrA [Bifidobacteriaceae bacterium]